jgi:hypothetical protein
MPLPGSASRVAQQATQQAPQHWGEVAEVAARGAPARPASAAAVGERLVWASLAAIAAGVIGLSFVLTPDPSGTGTHQQLGLPPCAFLHLTALPCPGCGLTTSFAHMARLELTSAVAAHPLGVPLYLLTLFGAGFSLTACVRGMPATPTLERLGVYRGALLLSIAALVTWLARLASILVA